MVSRRRFSAGAIAAILIPMAARAQQPGKVWRVAFLVQRHLDFTDTDFIYGPFRQGMRELGYVEGKNLAIEWRSAEGRAERLPELAAELVRSKPDVLATQGTSAAMAAQKTTATLPIVMASVGDPVGSGLVKSLARPGGNSTGLSLMTAELAPKLLEMLRETAPKAARVAVLVNPSNVVNIALLKNVEAAAKKLGAKIQPVEAGTAPEIEKGIAAMARQNAGALIVPLDSLFQQHISQIAALAAKQRLPSIGAYGEYTAAGGLMSYGQNLRETYRRAATYVDKIFKGTKPADLPVEQPTIFELALNMKTAKALGLKLPQAILIQATRVIE